MACSVRIVFLIQKFLGSPTFQKMVSRRYKELLITRSVNYSGLDFTAQALRQNLDKPNEELSDSFRSAYGNTLKPHHSFVIKPIFSAAMSATPYRKDFYAKLGGDNPEAQSAMKEWVDALEKRVAILKEFQGRKEAKW